MSSRVSSFHVCLLYGVNAVWYLLALCPHIVSRAPQHVISSETQATCDDCFARQSVCSVVSLHSGMSRAVHPQEFSKVMSNIMDTCQVMAFHSTFQFLLLAQTFPSKKYAVTFIQKWNLDDSTPSKHAGSDSHPVRIRWEALARSGPDDSCSPTCFRTGSGMFTGTFFPS